jgi:hypothetical protein
LDAPRPDARVVTTDPQGSGSPNRLGVGRAEWGEFVPIRPEDVGDVQPDASRPSSTPITTRRRLDTSVLRGRRQAFLDTLLTLGRSKAPEHRPLVLDRADERRKRPVA